MTDLVANPPALMAIDADGVATVTLNRPDRLNAMDAADWPALRDIFDAISLNRDVRAVVLTGAGRGFCAGANIKERGSDLPLQRMSQERMRNINSCALALRHVPQPMIAAVNGVAVGAGWSLALNSDIVFAADMARFSLKFIDVGLTLDLGGTSLIARHLGPQMAKHLAFTAEMLSAEDALALGLVFRVVPAADVVSSAQEYARALTTRPTEALSFIKDGLNRASAWTFEEACEFENQAQAACIAERIAEARAQRT